MYEPLWRHLREYTALGAGPATDLCLFLEQTGYAAAPGPFLATALFTSLVGGDGETTGTVAFLDDPMNPFVLEADRVERIAVIGPGPTVAVVDTADVRDRLRFVVDRRLLAPVVPARHAPTSTSTAAARPRSVRRAGATARTCRSRPR